MIYQKSSYSIVIEIKEHNSIYRKCSFPLEHFKSWTMFFNTSNRGQSLEVGITKSWMNVEKVECSLVVYKKLPVI